MKSATVVLLFLLGATQLFGLDYTNSELAFSAKVPDGMADYSSHFHVKLLICLTKGLHSTFELIYLRDLKTPIVRQDLSKAPIPADTTLEKTAWKSFDIDVFKVSENFEGVHFVTFNAQIPLVPDAVQLSVAGPAANEARLRTEMQAIVASVEGTSNWLTPAGASRNKPINIVTFLIGVIVLVTGRIRLARSFGLRGKGARIAGVIIIILATTLPEIFRGLVPFLLSLGLGLNSLVIIYLVFSVVVLWSAIAILIKMYGNGYAADSDEARVRQHIIGQPAPQPMAPAPAPASVVKSKVATECGMCLRLIPLELQATASVCPNCGADLTRWRR